MPLIYERAFRIRSYECDAYGHVNNANYLRFMQEAAFEASAAGGYDLKRYEGMGQYWLIRESQIEYLSPLLYGDTVLVKTWLEQVRRVRARRMYTFTRRTGAQLVARAYSDWVYLDRGTNRPVGIPGHLIEAFFPEGAPPPAPHRDPFPDQPPPPDGVFTIRRPVEWRDIDTAQHLNNAAYLAYIEDAGIQICKSYGWPVSRQMSCGFGIVARRHRIEYLRPAGAGDELRIATWVSNVRRSTALRHYTIRRAGEGDLLGRASTLWVWVDLSSGRPIRIPPEFIRDFAPNIVGG